MTDVLEIADVTRLQECHLQNPSFSDVKVITILELVLGKRHHGRVLCGRIIMQPYQDRSLTNAREYLKGGTKGGRVNLRLRIQPHAYSSVTTVLQDPDGAVVQVVIFNVLPSNISAQEIGVRFPMWMRMAIRDPFCKVSVDGSPILRVDNPGDISLFDESHSDEKEKFAADNKNDNGEEDLETIRSEGNRLFREQDWAGAVIKYSRCIDQALCRRETLKNMKDKTNLIDNINRVLMLTYSNRAEARLRLSDMEDAFSDADNALKLDPVHIKSLLRKGKAAHGLGLYKNACNIFVTGLRLTQPLQQAEKTLFSTSLEVSLTSLKQSRTGHFDLTAFYSRGGLRCDAPFCADFLGPLEISRVNYGFGRRGLFATRDVEDGAIMLVSNPLALVWKSLQREYADDKNVLRSNFCSQHLLKQLTKRVAASKRHKAQLHSLVSTGVRTLTQNDGVLEIPSMEIPSMELFTPGSEWVPPHPEKMDLDDMDYVRITNLLNLNTFGISDTRVINLRSKRELDDYDEEVYLGIWVLPSFLNHSCTPNCVAEAVGEAVFVRAIENVKKGEELTISYLDNQCEIVDIRRRSTEKNWSFTCTCERCLWEEAMKPRLAHVTEACRFLGTAMSEEKFRDKSDEKWQHTSVTKDFLRLKFDIEAIIDSLDSTVDVKKRGWIRALFFDVYTEDFNLAPDDTSELNEMIKIIVDSLCSLSDPVGAHEWLFSQPAPIIEKYFQSRPRPTVPAAWMVGES